MKKVAKLRVDKKQQKQEEFIIPLEQDFANEDFVFDFEDDDTGVVFEFEDLDEDDYQSQEF